ncbi:MAG: hypothetical protein ACK5XN_00940 [Bacteroidota bacterium]
MKRPFTQYFTGICLTALYSREVAMSWLRACVPSSLLSLDILNVNKFFHLIVSLIINFINMKKTFAFGLRTLVALFVLLSGLFVASEATAQSSLNGSVASTTSWLATSDAITVAEAQVAFYHSQGPFAPGTSNYNNWLRHAAFYKSIVTKLNEQMSVEEAINQSLIQVATVGGEREAAFTSKEVLQSFKQEAVELLSN